MRVAGLGSKYVTIAFALGLAGAIAACSGDDSVTPGGGGGSGGTTSDAARGGGGIDAAADRADVSTNRGGGGAGGADVSTQGGGGAGGSVDAAPDRPDAVDSARTDVADTAPDRGPDAIAPSDASDGGIVSDATDARIDVVPDTQVGDGNDGARPPDATIDVNAVDAADSGQVTLLPSQVSPTWTGDGTGSLVGDAGVVQWTSIVFNGGEAVLSADFTPPQDWSAYGSAQVNIRVTGSAGGGRVIPHAAVQTGDAGTGNFTSADDSPILGDGLFSPLFITLAGDRSIIDTVRVELTLSDGAAAPAGLVIEIVSIVLSP